MRTRVKICGITSQEDAQAAIDAGADALGFILHPASPRYIPAAEAQKILEILPPFVERVAVVVDPTLDDMLRHREAASFSLWQLHGQESSALTRELTGFRLIKALSLPTALTAADLEKYAVEAFLLDTAAGTFGGTGRVFDWSLVSDFRRLVQQPIILSGGLNPGNVVQAIERVRPYAIDLSSGVEHSPGRKDHAKIHELFSLCRNR